MSLSGLLSAEICILRYIGLIILSPESPLTDIEGKKLVPIQKGAATPDDSLTASMQLNVHLHRTCSPTPPGCVYTSRRLCFGLPLKPSVAKVLSAQSCS